MLHSSLQLLGWNIAVVVVLAIVVSLARVSGFLDGNSIKSRFKILAAGKQVHRNTWRTNAAILMLFGCSLCLPVSAQRDAAADDEKAQAGAFELRPIRRLEGITALQTHRSSFSPNGELLAVSGGQEADSRIYRVSDGSVLAKFDTENKNVFDLQFTPDGKAVASAGRLGVVLSDSETGKELRRFEGHTSPQIDELDISADGRWLVTGTSNQSVPDADATMRVWDIATGKQLHVIELRGAPAIEQNRMCKLNSMEISPDGMRVLATVSFHGDDGHELCGMVAEYNIATEDVDRMICVLSPDVLKEYFGVPKLPGKPVELTKRPRIHPTVD